MLNTGLAVTIGTCAVTSTTAQKSTDFYVVKFKGFCFVQGQLGLKKAFDADTYIQLAVLSLHPSSKVYFPATFSDGYAAFGYVNTDGVIFIKKCGKLMQANDWCTFNFSYR